MMFRKFLVLFLVTALAGASYPLTSFAENLEEATESRDETLETQELSERLDTFLAVCSDDEVPMPAPTLDYSCALEAEALEPLILELEEKQVAAEISQANCAEVEDILPEASVDILKEDLTSELQCKKEDEALYKKSCSEEFGCNVLRSGMSASQVFPSVIRAPIVSFLEAEAEKNGGGSCLDSSKSNCLTELWTTFVANIHDTATSLWELGKLGWDSLWNLGEFFDDKADEVHMAASQTKEDVITFWKSPGAWMYKQFNKMKDSVEDWMKSSVFCQKWKGTPHMPDSECVEPLETFGCINCGDMTNAFCAAAGVLASELTMVFLTAGIGNTVSTGTRLGLRVAGEVAMKAGSKIAKAAPKMMKLAPETAKASRVSKGAKVAIEATFEASRVAVKISSEKIAEAKALFIRYKDGLMDTKVAQVTLRTAEIASMPMAVFDRAAEKGLVLSERVMMRSLPGPSGRYIRKQAALRAMDDSHVSERLQFAFRQKARSARHVGRYEGKDKRSDSETRPGAENNSGDSSDDRRPARRGPGEDDDSSLTSRERLGQQRDPRQRDGRETPEIANDSRNDREKRRRSEEEARLEREKRNSQAEGQGHPQNNEKKSESHLGSALILGDAALKSADLSSVPDQFSEEVERLVETRPEERGFEKEIETTADAVEAIVGKSTPGSTKAEQGVSDSEVKARYEKLQETYSDDNRPAFVDSAVAATGISRTEAESFFEKRQKEIDRAGKLLYPDQLTASTRKKKALEDLRAQLAGLGNDMNKLEEDWESDENFVERRDKRERTLGEDESFLADDFVDYSSSEGRDPYFAEMGPSAVFAGVGAGGVNLGRGTASSLGESQDIGVDFDSDSSGSSWDGIQGEAISDNETKILESLISVDALHFKSGEPDELANIEKQFGLDIDGEIAYGKIKSTQGEFLFIKDESKVLVFKRKNRSWIKIESPSLTKLLKSRKLATL